jgi:outer membrane protein assembly factor BamB
MVLGRGVRMFLGRGSSGKKVLVAVEPGEGRVRFTSEELGPLFDRKGRRLGTADPLAVYGSPAVDHRATLGYDQEILYTGEKELTAFDLESGAVRWQVRDVEMDGWVYDGDALYVLGDKKLSAFRLADGSRKWSRKSREGSSLILTDHGLLLGCSSFSCWNEIELVDTTAGEPAWTAPAKLSEGSSAILWKGDHVLIATSEGVWRLDVASGAVSALASVEFRGNEGPTTIGETSRGLYVMSNQNVAVLDSAGSLRAHQYYKPPGLSTLEKIGRIALSTALTALSYAQASASASSMAKQNAFLSSMSGGSGVGRGFAFYQIHFPNLRARATATQRIDHLLYVYTEEADARGREGFSLVQFDASDGKEVGRAWVQQRRPKMRIDPVLNLVYVQRTLETVEAIGFEPARPSSGR